MKKILFIFAILLVLGNYSYVQKVEIKPQYGYQVGAKYNYYGGYLKLESSDQYGLTFGINTTDDICLEFMWAQQNTDIKSNFNQNNQNRT